MWMVLTACVVITAAILRFSLGIIDRSSEEAHKLEQRLRQGERLESLGRLAGGVAHDLNNLLTIILGNADLARGPTGEVDERALGEIAPRRIARRRSRGGSSRSDASDVHAGAHRRGRDRGRVRAAAAAAPARGRHARHRARPDAHAMLAIRRSSSRSCSTSSRTRATRSPAAASSACRRRQ